MNHHTGAFVDVNWWPALFKSLIAQLWMYNDISSGSKDDILYKVFDGSALATPIIFVQTDS